MGQKFGKVILSFDNKKICQHIVNESKWISSIKTYALEYVMNALTEEKQLILFLTELERDSLATKKGNELNNAMKLTQF